MVIVFRMIVILENQDLGSLTISSFSTLHKISKDLG